jgi:hypothetical protein
MSLQREVLASVAHQRHRGEFVPLWRILMDLREPATPAAAYRALERLQREGKVESRRVGRVLHWRHSGDPS